MTEIIYAIQVVLAVMFALWTYDRYAKRWSAILGEDVAHASVHDVADMSGMNDDYHSGYVLVSYGYSVSGKRYFGSFRRARFERHDYPKGREITVFYFRDAPAEHWLYKPPSRWAIFWKAFGLPALLLVLTYIPLIFIDLLISLRAG